MCSHAIGVGVAFHIRKDGLISDFQLRKSAKVGAVVVGAENHVVLIHRAHVAAGGNPQGRIAPFGNHRQFQRQCGDLERSNVGLSIYHLCLHGLVRLRHRLRGGSRLRFRIPGAEEQGAFLIGISDTKKKRQTDWSKCQSVCRFFHKDPCSRRKSVHSEQSHRPVAECCSSGQPIPFGVLLSATR